MSQIFPGNVISRNFSVICHSESLECILECAVNKDALRATSCTLVPCHLSSVRIQGLTGLAGLHFVLLLLVPN